MGLKRKTTKSTARAHGGCTRRVPGNEQVNRTWFGRPPQRRGRRQPCGARRGPGAAAPQNGSPRRGPTLTVQRMGNLAAWEGVGRQHRSFQHHGREVIMKKRFKGKTRTPPGKKAREVRVGRLPTGQAAEAERRSRPGAGGEAVEGALRRQDFVLRTHARRHTTTIHFKAMVRQRACHTLRRHRCRDGLPRQRRGHRQHLGRRLHGE